MPFSYPLLATKRHFGRQTPASLGLSIAPMFAGSISRFGDSPHTSATPGKSVVFRPLTGGLLVRRATASRRVSVDESSPRSQSQEIFSPQNRRRGTDAARHRVIRITDRPGTTLELRHPSPFPKRQQHVAGSFGKSRIASVGRPAEVGRQHDVRQPRQRVGRGQRLLREHVQPCAQDA